MPLQLEPQNLEPLRVEEASTPETPSSKELPLTALKSMPEAERPRERLLRTGGAAVSDAELLAVMLRVGRPGQSALEMAREILAENNGLGGLLTVSARTLIRDGLGPAKAATLLAAIELGRRLARAEIPARLPLDRADRVADYLTLRYGRLDQEVMGALYLDIRNGLIADVEIYRGTLNRTAVEPRLIFKEALERGAAAFILFHNHPSGDPTPSAEDISFTQRVHKAGKVLGIRLVDHLILGSRGRWTSLSRLGACE